MDTTASLTDRAWKDLHTGLRVFVSRRLPVSADVDDVVQQVFAQVLRGLPALRDTDRLHAWMYRTARNVIADYYRRPGRRREIASGALEDLEHPAGYEKSGHDDAAAGELAACVRPLLESLPSTDAEALRLTELEGLRQAEAARRLGLSTSGMKSRVQRARGRLKGLLEACCRIELDRRHAVVGYEGRKAGRCGGNDGCAKC